MSTPDIFGLSNFFKLTINLPVKVDIFDGILIREKLLKIQGKRPRLCRNFEITRAIYLRLNIEKSEQF